MSAVSLNKGTVCLVDDDLDVREGLKQLIESVDLHCEIYASPTQFFQRTPTKGPSCLILDVRLPGMSGLDLQTSLITESKSIPTIIITGFGDIPMTVRAMKSGAVAFLTKPVREQDLIEAVFVALKQDRSRLQQEQSLDDLRSRFQNLSPREQEILPLVTAGFLNKQIAVHVGLSEVTVKVHRHKLIAKLQAKTLPDLVRMADTLGVRYTKPKPAA